MGNTIRDHDPPTGNVINTAGVVDMAAGALLLVFSELIHNIIGLVLIALGAFLVYYANFKRRDDLPDTPHSEPARQPAAAAPPSDSSDDTDA